MEQGMVGSGWAMYRREASFDGMVRREISRGTLEFHGHSMDTPRFWESISSQRSETLCQTEVYKLKYASVFLHCSPQDIGVVIAQAKEASLLVPTMIPYKQAYWHIGCNGQPHLLNSFQSRRQLDGDAAEHEDGYSACRKCGNHSLRWLSMGNMHG